MTDELLGIELAIVGMAGRFPGAYDIDEFWHNLRAGTESIRTLDAAELDALGVDAATRSRPGFVPRSAFLDDADCFDAEFFGVQPREAELMDPQQRVFLECCWHALESACSVPGRDEGVVSVFGGTSMSSYLLFHLVAGRQGSGSVLEGLRLGSLNAPDFLTTRVAYKLGLTGPAVTVQTACSSSLVAVHMAGQSLLARECDIAIAGGVSVQVHHRGGYVHTPQDVTSPDGVVRPFDAAASGTVFGSGVGAVVLKRLEDALAAGDRIRAVIRSTAVNNDGEHKAGFVAPSVEGQADVIAQALANAELTSADVDYVETHGTATQLGDSIEIRALRRVFGDAGRCLIGSVKGNIGHLDAAAGVSGLIKTVLAMEHAEIPPTVHFREPGEHLGIDGSPFQVNGALTSWPDRDAPRRAGVSSFGVGGTNAHVVLEQAPSVPRSEDRAGGWQIVPWSARTPAALRASGASLAGHLAGRPDLDLGDVAFTAQHGRAQLPHRSFVVANDTASAVRALADGDADLVGSGVAAASEPGVGFLFPGMGSYHKGMAAGLYRGNAAFRGQLDELAALIDPRIGRSLAGILLDEDAAWVRRPELAMPALFAVEYALADTLMSYGVRPAAWLGHSLGEYTAACLADVMTPADAVDIVCTRGELVAELPEGAMLSVALPEDEVIPLLDERLSLAAVNAPSSCVVSGLPGEVRELAGRLDRLGVRHRALPMAVGFHSHLVDPVLDRFGEAVARIRLRQPKGGLLSNLTGDWAGEAVTRPDYWVRHLRRTVRFADCVRAAGSVASVLVEVGPGQTLRPLARLAGDATVISTLGRAEDTHQDEQRLAQALGRLWTAGVDLDWRSVRPTSDGGWVDLPPYPFERRRFWVEPVRGQPVDTGRNGDMTNHAASTPSTVSAGSVVSATSAVSDVSAVADRIAHVLGRVSGLSAPDLDRDANLFELGFDSLALVQAGDAIKQAFEVSVPIRQFFEELTTINLLAGHVAAHTPVVVAVPTPSTVGPPQPVPAGAGVDGVIAAQLELLRRQGELQQQLLEQLAVLRGGQPPARVPPGVTAPAPRRPSGSFTPQGGVDTSGSSLTERQRAHVAKLAARYNARTATSKRRTQESRMVRANHRNCLNFRSEFKELIYPILVQNGHGGRFVDVDGNTYVDLAMGFGASFFGHEPEFVVEAVRRELTEGQGMLIGPCTPHAEEVARLVAELTGVERVAFYNTGTQAVMLALRLARAATGRTKVAVFTGAFHGIYDGTLVRPDYLADGPEAAPGVPGVTEGSVRDVLIVDYGDPAALDVLRPHAHELAAVLVEPVQSRNPDLQPRRFLHALREFASAAGAALIFDETITGFRLHPGGAQALFGVPADIVTFGKVAGGGMPIGIVAGRAFYLDGVDGGVWSYGDDSFPPNDERRTFLGGTFCEHPLAMVAAAAALRHVRDHSPALQDGVNRRMTDLVARLDALFAAEQVPITTEHCGSMLRLVVPRDLELIWYHLLDEGVYTWEGRTLFLSTAHTDADVDHVVEAFARGIAELRSGGFLPERPGGPDQLALTDEQRQMWFAATAGQAAVDSVLVRLRGELDSDALVRAFHRLVNRHEALRTGLSGDGEHQLVYPAVTVDVPVLDWSDVPDADARLVEWARERTAEPFDLARPPLLRAWLIRRGGDDHELVLLGHHLVVDGWSWTVLVEEFAALYAGRTLPAAPRFRDFLRRRAAVLDGPHGVAAREHWRRVLADPPAPLRLGDSGRGGGRVSTVVDAKLYPRLIEVARARHCTVPMVLFAGLQLLLNQITGRTDLVVGLPTAGQLATGATGLVGNCANVLPIRVTLGDGSIADLLGTVRATVSDAYQHQAVSIAGLVAHQGPGGEPELVPPDLSVVCNVDKSVALSVTGLRVDARPGPMGAARAELFVNAVVDEGTLRLDFDAAPTITRSTCETWLRAYTELLAAIADDPDRALARLPRVVERFDPIEDAFGSGQPSDAEHVAPRSDAERRVARVWAELFELPEPSVHTSFFELGGTSLIATRLVSRLARAFQRPVPLRAVFDAPTVAKLAEFLTAEAPVADPASVVVAGDRDHGEFPLSLAQRRLWYLEQLGTGTSYTVFVAVRMHGQLDRGVLTACVREVVRRHAALRTTFREVDGEATQLIAPPDEVAVEVPLTDLSTAEDPAGAVRRELRAELDRPFDIGAGPLLRTRLLRLADDEHVMAVSMHHIVSDGWSLDVLLREVLVLYEAFGNGQPSPLPKLPVQYPDFAVWQQDWLNSEEFVRQLDYWRERLAGLAPLELPIDRPRPLTPDFAGRIHRFTLPGSVSDEVRRFSQAEQVSLLTTLLAAFQALLHAVCGQDDIAVGTPSANRNHLETEGLIGFFLNMLVIRTDVGGRPTFRELVGQVRDRVLGADANQAVPFDLLVDELGAVRDAAHSPLFNVMFLLDTSNSRWQAAGLELTRVDYEWHTSKFDLSLLVDDVDGELRCVFEYRTDLFDHDTIELLANRFETFVGKVTANPEARL